VDKRYLVWVLGFSDDNVKRLKQPVTLDGYTIRTPGIRLIKAEGEKALLQVTIHEGRNRQIRRMCELAGMKVQRLKRIAEGVLELGDLPLGKWRHLTSEEINNLKNNFAIFNK
jgi:23S rRNA pseudouridine2605 synthase